MIMSDDEVPLPERTVVAQIFTAGCCCDLAAAAYTIFVKSSLASHVSLRPIKGARTLGHCFIFRT